MKQNWEKRKYDQGKGSRTLVSVWLIRTCSNIPSFMNNSWQACPVAVREQAFHRPRYIMNEAEGMERPCGVMWHTSLITHLLTGSSLWVNTTMRMNRMKRKHHIHGTAQAHNNAVTMGTSCQLYWASGVCLPRVWVYVCVPLAGCPGHGKGTGQGWHTRPPGFGKDPPGTHSLRRSGCSWQGRWSKCPGSFSRTVGPPPTDSFSTAPHQDILHMTERKNETSTQERAEVNLPLAVPLLDTSLPALHTEGQNRI